MGKYSKSYLTVGGIIENNVKSKKLLFILLIMSEGGEEN